MNRNSLFHIGTKPAEGNKRRLPLAYVSRDSPLLYIGNPEEKLWLTDDRSVSPTRQPIFIDSTGHVYQPTDVLGPVLVKVGTCGLAFYEDHR